MLRELVLRKVEAVMASRPPDFEIGPPGDRYMQRWIVGRWGRGDPRNKSGWKRFGRKFPNLYLHKILHDDEDRALHDHPFASASVVLKSGYWEVLFYPISEERIARLLAAGEPRPTVKVFRPEGSITFRRAETAHRLVLERRADGSSIVAISAFFVGFRTRDWGFLCPKRWRHWTKFVSDRDRGAVGSGCGEDG
jgi:hypothetical protein